MRKICTLLLILTAILVSCSNDKKKTVSATIENEAGTKDESTSEGVITYTYGQEIKQYDIDSREEKTILQNAKEAFIAADGSVYFIQGGFPKENYLVKKSNNSYSEYSEALDMSSDNPDYRAELENYSVINGTGISGILDRLYDPKVSPDGKYLSVTIIGHKGQGFENNCIGIFDLATKKLVTKFDDLYYGSWMKDGRLLAAGGHKTVSTDRNLYNGPKPGIYIIDINTNTSTRIDPQLNDPFPYHPALSPDEKKIAFIRNDHVWTIDIDGKNARQLTLPGGDNIETFPVWSPDGRSIACWVYKTFERSYFTALAIIPFSDNQVALTDEANVWPRDRENNRISGGSMNLVWK